MSLMGNVIEPVRSKGSDYWAAFVGGEKIKTDRLKQHSRTDVIPYQWPILGLSKFPNLYVYNSLIAPSK